MTPNNIASVTLHSQLKTTNTWFIAEIHKTREMCSRIDTQTHAGWLEIGFDLWPFDFRVIYMRGSYHVLYVYRLWCC